MTDEWYYAKNRQRVGPVSLEELNRLLGSGLLQPTDMVIRQGSQKWVAANTIAGMEVAAPQGAGMPQRPPAEHQAACAGPASSSANGSPLISRNSDGPQPGPAKHLLADADQRAPDAVLGGQQAPGASASKSGRAITNFLSVGRSLLHEIQETALATWRQSVRLIGCGKCRWRQRSLSRDASAANLALGQRMLHLGIGDGQLRSQIAALEETSKPSEVKQPPAKGLKLERERLLVQLAEAALADQSPPPGAVQEYAKAREAQAALDKHAQGMAAARLTLPPRGYAELSRVLVGYGAVAFLVALSLVLLGRAATPSARPSAPPTQGGEQIAASDKQKQEVQPGGKDGAERSQRGRQVTPVATAKEPPGSWERLAAATLTWPKYCPRQNSVVFLADGKTLAILQDHVGIRLHDALTGKEVTTIIKDTGLASNFLSSSPDGAYLIWRVRKDLVFWDIANKRMHTPIGVRDKFLGDTYVVFSPDGKSLVTVSRRNVTLLDYANRTVKADVSGTYPVAFSTDSRLLAMLQGHNILCWDNINGRELNKFQMPASQNVQRLSLSHDGRWLAAVTKPSGYDAVPLVLDTARNTEVELDQNGMPSGKLADMVFSPHNTTLAALYDRDGAAVLFLFDGPLVKLKTSIDLGFFEPSTPLFLGPIFAPLTPLVFSPDGKTIVIAGMARPEGRHVVFAVDVATGYVARLEGHDAPVKTVVFSKDGQLLATLDADKALLTWRRRPDREGTFLLKRAESARLLVREPKREEATFERGVRKTGHSEDITSLGFSPDGQYLASASHDRTVKLWDAATGAEIRMFKGHTDCVYCVGLSPDGKLLASGDHRSTVKVWDVASGQAALTLQGHPGVVKSLAFNPDGTLLASGSLAVVKLWDVRTGKEVRTLTGNSGIVDALAFSPDGTLLASGCSDGITKVWDSKTWREAHSFKQAGRIRSVAISPNKKVLATGCAYQKYTVLLWNLATGKTLSAFEGQGDTAHVVAFSPNGRLFASAGTGFRVWDVSVSPAELVVEISSQGFNMPFQSLLFSPDGKRLAYATRNMWTIRNISSFTPEGLAAELKDRNPKVRLAAALDLAGSGVEYKSKQARQGIAVALKQALTDEDVGVRAAAAVGLTRLDAQWKPDVKLLAEALKLEGNNVIRLASVQALARLGSHAEAAIPALAETAITAPVGSELREVAEATLDLIRKRVTIEKLLAERKARELKVRIHPFGQDPSDQSKGAAFNRQLREVKVYATANEVYLDLDVDADTWVDVGLCFALRVRVLDAKGQKLADFVSSERFTGSRRIHANFMTMMARVRNLPDDQRKLAGYFEPVLLRTGGNVLTYPVSQRDLRDAGIAEVGFFNVSN